MSEAGSAFGEDPKVFFKPVSKGFRLQINMYPVLVAEESISKEVMFHLILKRQTEARMQFEAFDSQQQTRLKRVRLAVM